MTDQFTYISAFLSIVIALALTHLLAGIAAILRVRVQHVSWRHVAWVGIYVFCCVDFWFSLWGLRNETSWSLAYVLYLLGLATILYIGCHLVMPRLSAEDASLDLVEFDEDNRRRYLAAFFAYMAAATIANLTIAGFADAVWINLSTLVLVACAWFWNDARLQWFVLVALWSSYVYYAVKFIPAI